MLQDKDRIEIIRYRIENAHRTLNEVQLHIDNGFYNTAMNRMYYACYYAASALLVAKHITTKSHDGVKQMFGLHFVKTGIVSEELGRFYSRLFDKRSKGDYEDLFDNTRETCENAFPDAKKLVVRLSQLANDCLKEQEQPPIRWKPLRNI